MAQPQIERMSEQELRALKGQMLQRIEDDRSQADALIGQIARINAYIRAAHKTALRSAG